MPWQPPATDAVPQNTWQPPAIDAVPQGTDYKQMASDYLIHPAVEGAAMTLGGAAGAFAGAPAGPVGSALAGTAGAAVMYPPAHRVANAIDSYIGVNRPAEPDTIQQAGKDFGTGLGIEAGGQILKPAAAVLGKVLPGAATGEALSGTPARNLSRAYKQGFLDTYITPNRLGPSTEALADAKTAVMGKISPEEQAAMLINPRGEANQKISDVYQKWLKGEPISAQDAIATRSAIDTVFPASTGKNMPRIAKFSEFRNAINGVIGDTSPEFKTASDNYAASKLRSDLLKPARVNKNNPNEYSKLGAMADVAAAMHFGPAGVAKLAAGILGTSPLAMGVTSSVSGSVAKGIESLMDQPSIRRAAIAALIDKYQSARNGQQSQQ